ncbi:TetR/AcrR family transcriptional regulator [Nocardioides sp. TF02-7]|uniref:TetR/AcrR family transcriptional regulator n=1 Tax=Nocardioides sp. TF02-7 TaxID=2917724 RepID=UPI001F05ED83|nr:TetR/AcrR family transcriptional regulator [Nocardioides sp. TF02-7]UMG94403.1 TetR/AcrR family transcriptional regulator [Nocardioides sp. TF02-7]
MAVKASTRDRLLFAGAELLQAAKGGDVSTRAITDAAGVQAPTLYHHFGSKQGLLDEVVSHGFRRFLEENEPALTGDPVAAVARAWDTHVRFGVEHPAFYAHLYARVEPGYRCGVVSQVELMLLSALERVADRLSAPPAEAAKAILAASSGVVITMIGELDGEPDWGLSDRVRGRRTRVPDPVCGRQRRVTPSRLL